MTATSHGNPHVQIRPEWLAQAKENIIDPTVPVVDAHHHLWNRPYYPYLFDRYLDDLNSGHNVKQTVYVESLAMHRASGPRYLAPVGETEFANGIAAMSASGGFGTQQVCAAIVSHADLRSGDHVEETLAAHTLASPDRFRGIRQIAAWHRDPSIKGTSESPPPGMMSDPNFRNGFSRLSKYGLTFDTWIYFTQLEELYDLAKFSPDTVIVLDHVGGILGIGEYAAKRKEVLSKWRTSVQRLSTLPNIRVKLSGLAMRSAGFDLHNRVMPPTSNDLVELWRPYFETCIGLFGPERCMFASNFPVDKGGCSYHILWNAYKKLVAGYSEDEKRYMLHDTACNTYRLT